MISHPDHVTIVVTDVAAATRFLSLLGFAPEKSVVIRGEQMARYMGVDGIECEHHTLALQGATPRFEIQLLRFLQPAALPNPELTTLRQVGFNHLCLATDDLDADLARLAAAGIAPRNAMMEFHDRRLVFLNGPDGVVIELAQWL